jgi:RNA polymerase sigma factor (sigma-70 family)
MAAIETSVRATAALDDLYRRHVGDVYRYSYAVLGNHADAEDVTQTTFVNALRALERGEEPRNASNWLLVIAHNIVRQRWRQAAARPTEVELVHDVPDTPDEDDVELDGLVRALQRIPASQREALVMRELEGRSYQEISELLGLTTSALETLLFRARRSLAEELENLVTCQNAELAISRRLDKRLSRKESRRLDEHLAECDACTRLVATQARQRRAFKGLAVLPLPVGLMLFKDAPTAAAASLPTIGTASSAATSGAGGAATGGVAAGGSLVGAAAVKVAAVLVAGVLFAGAAFEGAKLVLGDDGVPSTATQEKAVKGAFAQRDLAAAPSAASAAPSQTAASAASAGLVGAAGAVAPPYRVTGAEEATDTGTGADAAAPGSDTPASTPNDGGPAADGPSDPAPQPDQPVVPPADKPASEPPTTPTPTTPVAPTATKPTKAKPTKGKKATPPAKKPMPPTAKSPGKGKTAPPGATKSETKPDSSAKPSDSPKSNGPDAKADPSAPGASTEPPSSATPAETPVETPADGASKHDHGADNGAAKK